jgi:hypothetical protein
MERAGRRTVLPVRVTISIERKRIEDMPGALAGDKADVAVETNQNNREKIPTICEHGVTEQWVAVSTIGIHPM